MCLMGFNLPNEIVRAKLNSENIFFIIVEYNFLYLMDGFDFVAIEIFQNGEGCVISSSDIGFGRAEILF